MRSFKSLFKAVKSIFQIRAARRSNPGKTRVLALFSVFIFSRKFTRFHAALKPIFRSLKPFQAFSSLFNLRARVFSFYMNTYTQLPPAHALRLPCPGASAHGVAALWRRSAGGNACGALAGRSRRPRADISGARVQRPCAGTGCAGR